jgi:hypothetical protein
MKIIKILNLILISLLVCSCNNNTQNNKRAELNPNPQKYEHDNYKPKEITFIPDSSIIGICLHSDSLVSSVLGDNYKMSLDANADIPNLIVINRKTNQLITFYKHPGGVIGEFAEFEVTGFEDYGIQESIEINDMEFQTESGIKLNMTIGALKSIKGEPDTTLINKTTTLSYRLDDIDKSSFLKRYNMPIYYADYEFKDGYLIRFKFGFDYP